MKSSLESTGGSKDSMILVTTRDKDVARVIHSSSVHELPELSEDDGWSLFKQVAFVNKSKENISMLETIGEKIVRKCKGNPLAIKTIGGILQTKQHSYEWENIERSELWDLPQDDETGILPSLKLSYNHLPSPFLKKCFSFCAALSKDEQLGNEWLTHQWMALGLIEQFDSRELMEDIAQGYINVLLNISFLQEAEWDDLGDINYYVMHDLVHDLATSVSRHELLLLEEGKQVTTISDVRHLSIYGHVEVTSDFWDNLVVENLRSLLIDRSSPRGLLEYVRYLRVLCLQYVGLNNVPKSIAGLKCLKYLSLRNIPIKVMPDYITRLYNLQALVLEGCKLLKELPRGLANLVNLRHLWIDSINKVPAGMIEQLRCLQTLPPLWVRDGGFQISELGYLPHVSGELKICSLEVIKSKQDAETARISEKSRLKKLGLFWNSDDNWVKHEEVLDGLKPNCNLRLLRIGGYGGEKFPSWFMRMGAVYNLVKIIELVGCTRCQKLPTLGNLPYLERLKITNMDRLEHIGAELYCNAEILTEDASSSSNFEVVYFPSLKVLQLCGLQNLREWGEPCSGVRSSRTFFPSLEELLMEDCPELTTTANNFPSLEKLTVKNNTSGVPVVKILDHENSLACLKNLHIKKVKQLTSLSQKLTEYCTSLQVLEIQRCHKLTCLPENLSKLIYLEDLQITKCSSLESLPNLSGLASLRCFHLFCNKNLKYPLEGLQCCTTLEELVFSICPITETLPDLKALTRLTALSLVGIQGMPKMIGQWPDCIYSLPCLQTLHIGRYDQLDHFPDINPLLKITSLKNLLLYGWKNQDADISLPEQLQHFKMLQQLHIRLFENLESLPDWIGNLSSLQILVLSRCKKLKKLAAEDAMKRLTKLSNLKFQECPLLEEAIKTNGTEHHMISHIQVDTE
ncbi:putative disease resistance protein RGA1 [Chenopodium quinoa]|uniref:putative disease resistance protein RGA1 n=1 Tax=Chenopodium quinoa TaxID=63459 RepID=UPI000B788767|nr:putative disease resistance protein RGA1 [Chenopodium quinoa]